MGGGGLHVDSDGVFLLRGQGARRCRYGHEGDVRRRRGLLLKIRGRFEPECEAVLEPGDLLYLPIGWAHDGVAVGADCMTCSIGLRAPARDELARSVLQRSLDETEPPEDDPLYRDPRQGATESPGLIPPALVAFAADAVARLIGDRRALACALGEVLTEPKPSVWFDAGGDGPAAADAGAWQLDRRSRMLYDEHHVFINGESYLASGRDARAMRELADRRCLTAAAVARLSPGARALLAEWERAGWLRVDTAG